MIIEKLRGALRSFVVWFNGVLLAALPLFEYAKDALPGLAPYVSDDIYKYVGIGVVVINLGLRFITKLDLAEK